MRYSYTRTSRVTGSVSRQCKITLSDPTRSVMFQIYDEIHEKFPNHSIEEIRARYLITDITLIMTKTECPGCRDNRPGQAEHMVHPDGCLHNPDSCFNCL
jgi:hypothetical protein